MGFIAEISSSFVDLISRLLGAQAHGSRDPAIFLALVLAGLAMLWLRRVNALLSEELLRTREVLLEKARIDELKLKVDDISYKVNTELTNFSRQRQKDEKRLLSVEEKLSKQPIRFELDNSETSFEDRIRVLEDRLGIKSAVKVEQPALALEQPESAPADKQEPKADAQRSEPPVSPWRLALEKTRQRLHQQLLGLVARTGSLGAAFPEAVRDVLTEHGLAACWTPEFQSALDALVRSSGETPSALGEQIESMLARAIKEKLQAGGDAALLPTLASQRPRVVMLLGSNSAERLEVAAELAVFLKQLGGKIVLGDCNTASTKNRDKLIAWGEQSGIPVFSPTARTKPSQIAYRAIHKAQDEHYDLVILYGPDSFDSKKGSDEWEQLRAIIEREQPGAPHEMLYIDNLSEAPKGAPSDAAIKPTGLIFTGFDLSDRGGLIVSRAEALQAPVRFVVMSQPRRQLQPFSPTDFATALCGTDEAKMPSNPKESNPDHSL